MLQAEYIRDMHNNYLVITGIKESGSSYGVKMLLNNTIPGFLKVELRCIDQLDLFYYDVTSLKTLTVAYENKAINYNEMKNLLSSVLCTIEHGGEFLLSENDFIVDPEYIFINTDSQTISLCHLVGHQVSIREQISRFMEYLMNKVNYQDERAVLLIYAMYKVSREVDCTFERLLLELNNKFTGSTEQNGTNKLGDSKVNKDPNVMNMLECSRNQDALNKIKYNKTNEESTNIKRTSKSKNKASDSGKVNLKKNPSKKYAQNGSIGTRKEKIKTFIEGNILRKSPMQKNTRPVNYDYGSKATGVIPEEIENEREISYFSYKTYLLAGISIAAGAVLFILVIQLKFLHNTFGSQIDLVKLTCCLIIISVVEILIMTRIFDKKNQMTRMVTDIEYVNPAEEADEYPVVSGVRRNYGIEDGEIKDKEILEMAPMNETTSEETALLWTNDDLEMDQTVILAKLHTQKQYYLEPCNTMTEIAEKESINVIEFPFIIGKSKKDINYRIEDNSVSRKHVEFFYDGGTVFITDLASTNGTYLNGSRLKGNEAYPISVNDEIAISNIKFYWKEK